MVGICIAVISIIIGMVGSSYAERKIIEHRFTIFESDYRRLFRFWLIFGTVCFIIGVALFIYGI